MAISTGKRKCNLYSETDKYQQNLNCDDIYMVYLTLMIVNKKSNFYLFSFGINKLLPKLLGLFLERGMERQPYMPCARLAEPS